MRFSKTKLDSKITLDSKIHHAWKLKKHEAAWGRPDVAVISVLAADGVPAEYCFEGPSWNKQQMQM